LKVNVSLAKHYTTLDNMKNLISIILLLIATQGLAQNFSAEEQHQIDSLNKVIANPNSPTFRARPTLLTLP
jgi:lipopolysaccharide export system protein LptC